MRALHQPRYVAEYAWLFVAFIAFNLVLQGCTGAREINVDYRSQKPVRAESLTPVPIPTPTQHPNAENRSPVAGFSVLNGFIGTTKVGSTATCIASASDPDGEAITYAYQWKTSATEGGVYVDSLSIGSNTATVTIAPSEAHRWFKCVALASDPHNAFTVSESIASQVSDSLPTATGVSISTAENTPVVVSLTLGLQYSDVDSDASIGILTQNVNNGTLSSWSCSAETCTSTFTPTTYFSGSASFDYQVVNTFASQAAWSNATITVNEVNFNPLLTSPGNKSLMETQTLAFTLAATYPDINSVVYSCSTGTTCAYLTVNTTSGLVSWTPTYGDFGSYSATFRATDNGSPALFDEKSVTITVTKAPPVFTSLNLANGAADGTLNAADVTNNLTVATLVASGYTTANYAIVASGITCNVDVNYNLASIPLAGDAGFPEGNTYKICVKLGDIANNVTYGTSNINLIVPDRTAPSVTLVAASPAAPNKASSTFTLSWTLGDNVTASGALIVNVYKKVTVGASTATTSDTHLVTETVGQLSVAGEAGTDNAVESLNYLIIARDAAGNEGSTTFSVVSNRVSPNVAITSPAVGVKTVALHYEVAGTCDSSLALNANLTGSGAQVVSSSCTGGVLAAKLLMPTAGELYTFTASQTNAAGNSTSVSRSFVGLFCPPGYVGIPGKWSDDTDITGLGNVNAIANHPTDAGLDPTKDFCLMKYPAKVATSNNGGQTAWDPVEKGNQTWTMANYWPESRSNGAPWTNINRDQSIDRCKALNEAFGLCSGAGCYTAFNNNTFGYRLVSNTEWQVAARNLENNRVNWSTNTVGSGVLNRGHSDSAVDTNATLHSQYFSAGGSLALSHPRWDLGYGYFGTGNGNTLGWNYEGASPPAGTEQKRTHTLSTGSQIWDMAGNIWQWVVDNDKDGSGGAGLPNVGNLTQGDMGVSATVRVAEYSMEYSDAGVTNSDRLLFGSTGGYSSTKNAGHLFVGSVGAVARGGSWGETLYSGLFTANLSNEPASTGNSFGFRCSYIPAVASADSNAPAVASVQRADAAGTSISNTSVTIGNGGLWNLKWTFSDTENSGVNANKIWVQVRRKRSSYDTDFPTLTDAVYRDGFNFTSLKNETAWELDENTALYNAECVKKPETVFSPV